MILRDTLTIAGTDWSAQVGRSTTRDISSDAQSTDLVQSSAVLPAEFMSAYMDSAEGITEVVHHGRRYAIIGDPVAVYVRGAMHHVALTLASSWTP